MHWIADYWIYTCTSGYVRTPLMEISPPLLANIAANHLLHIQFSIGKCVFIVAKIVVWTVDLLSSTGLSTYSIKDVLWCQYAPNSLLIFFLRPFIVITNNYLLLLSTLFNLIKMKNLIS